ncbi:hypothetical protein [Actinotalea sp. JY-7876]|uniref:hypothetical protein n=1 Tax=Actinotalea sp. JY-7876 TaxID=2758442 RepID=UPI0015F3C02F|nr:hypothetical protein [Actinotalea sp. JY-7876]
MKYTTRPLSDRAWLRAPAERATSQFKVTWSQASDLLERELNHLDATGLVIEVDVREQDLRLDGTLRAQARVESPAVIVAFDSKHGPLLYRSDQYAGAPSYRTKGLQAPWQHNVYAVALTLEALRAVDRYGAARSGEQYRGYRQIGGGPAIVTNAPMSRAAAAEVLAKAAWPDLRGDSLATATSRLLEDPAYRPQVTRLAQRNTHPDTGGSAYLFDEVQRAITVLRGDR